MKTVVYLVGTTILAAILAYYLSPFDNIPKPEEVEVFANQENLGPYNTIWSCKIGETKYYLIFKENLNTTPLFKAHNNDPKKKVILRGWKGTPGNTERYFFVWEILKP